MDKRLGKKPNKIIVFRPHTQFRFLKGQMHMGVIKTDLVQYNEHLYRVFIATPKVDANPPFLNPFTYLKPKQRIADAVRVKELDAANKHLVSRINATNRSPPTVDCWNVFCKPKSTRVPAYNAQLVSVMKGNLELLDLIKAAKSTYARELMRKRWQIISAKFDKRIKLEKVFHTKKPLDVELAAQPSLTKGLTVDYVFPRRRAFIDFSFKNGVRLGQIVVELYYEHSPKMVENFLAHCDDAAVHSYRTSRIFYGEQDGYFALGDVTSNNGRGGHSIYHRNISVQPNRLRGRRMGLLLALPVATPAKFDKSLTIRERIEQKPPPPEFNSIFAITLGACVAELSGLPIFGKVIRGNRVLCKINDTLRHRGTPLETIVISRCGCVPLTPEEETIISNLEEQMFADGVQLLSSSEGDSAGEEIDQSYTISK